MLCFEIKNKFKTLILQLLLYYFEIQNVKNIQRYRTFKNYLIY